MYPIDSDRISDRLIKSMRNWSHSGFSVDNSVKIEEDNIDAMSRLAQYIVHSSFSQEKIKFIAFVQDYAAIQKILKHLNLWPVEYPRKIRDEWVVFLKRKEIYRNFLYN